ncbi:hypothetical protein BI49514_00675 [Brevibacterium iodinum ATCC 49514]|uniref:Uncharacterized protein n=1 Tax=Brevibacterium iodinum ATCC 49514 TaxID=1255616 RepID=A0A2H1I5W2_9MICO|nr:hypothetical protein BI49514_00675 [Brevibacterium iodinum ATCC 49514]SUW12599.1 Uncharacterised protein [Brevibacterium iodinum]
MLTERGDRVSKGADPVIDAAVADSGDQRSDRLAGRRPDLAEVAEQTRGLRRLISRIGTACPVFFAVATVAVSSAIAQPLHGTVDIGELGLWTLGTLLLLTPFAAALAVMLNARRGGLVWTTALVYSVIAGIIGLCVDANLLRTDPQSAALSFISVLIVQVVVLAPVCAAVAFLVRIVSDSTRLRATGKNFDNR